MSDETLEAVIYPGGAQRSSEAGRGRFDLLPWLAISRVALRAELGANQYGEDNWRRGLPPARFFSSAIRHLAQWRTGERSEDHLAAAAWNILALIEVLESEVRSGNQAMD